MKIFLIQFFHNAINKVSVNFNYMPPSEYCITVFPQKQVLSMFFALHTPIFYVLFKIYTTILTVMTH